MSFIGFLLTGPEEAGNYISMMYLVRNGAIRIIAPASVETPGADESRSVSVCEGTSNVHRSSCRSYR
jgi:hypothetical protein